MLNLSTIPYRVQSHSPRTKIVNKFLWSVKDAIVVLMLLVQDGINFHPFCKIVKHNSFYYPLMGKGDSNIYNDPLKIKSHITLSHSPSTLCLWALACSTLRVQTLFFYIPAKMKPVEFVQILSIVLFIIDK